MPSTKKNGAKTPHIVKYDGYYSDITPKDTLSAAIIRSPIQNGIITSVSHINLPDGYSIFTARDVPGTNLVTIAEEKIPLFSEGNVSYRGEPLGILVGPDERTIKKLLSEIQISYDEKPIEEYLGKSSFSVTEAQEKGKKRKHKGEEHISLDSFFSGKVEERVIEFGPCFAKRGGKIEGIEKIFEKAPHVAEHTWSYTPHKNAFLEKLGAVCSFKGENLTVYAPTQWHMNMRSVLSEALHLSGENVFIKKSRVTGTTTTELWYPAITAAQVAVAAYRTKKPVKLVYSRQEQEQFVECALPIRIRHKTAANLNGDLLAMQIHIDFDIGSANPFAKEMIDRLSIAASGVYRAQNVSITATAFRSNNPPSSVPIEQLDAASFFAIENQMNMLGSHFNLTPLEFRMQNLVSSNKKARTLFDLSLPSPEEVLHSLTSLGDFTRKNASYTLAHKIRERKNDNLLKAGNLTTPLRGIGLSCAFEGEGYLGSDMLEAGRQAIELSMQNDTALLIKSPPISRSLQNAWAKIAASSVGISPSNVKITQFDMENEAFPIIEGETSNIGVLTILLKKCCTGLRKHKAEGNIPCKIKKMITASQKSLWDRGKFFGKPFFSTAFAAVALEAELDPCTFRISIRNLDIVISCGSILNITAAENTVKRAVQHVLLDLVEGDKVSCQNMRIFFVASNGEPAQIGRLVYNILPAAFSQAVLQASGCRVDTLPLQQRSIFESLEQKNKTSGETGV